MAEPASILYMTLYVIVGHLTSTCHGQLENTTVSTTTPSTTTLPANPGKVMFIIIPVSILVGIPVTISLFCCIKALFACCSKKVEKVKDGRRVTPINDPDAWESKIHNVNISQQQSDMFAYDGQYNSTEGGGGYETHAQYGWDF